MDLRICFALACLLGVTLSAPAGQQTTRNFIPNRYELRGELLNDDGSFSRQDPPEDEPSLYDEFNGQDNGLSYDQQQAGGYPQYGQYAQAYSNFQTPGDQYAWGGQNAYYNSPSNEQTTNDMPLPTSESDDITKDESNDGQAQSQQSYYGQPQQQQPLQGSSEPEPYQNYAFNDQQQQQQQQYYYAQQQPQQMQYQQQYDYQPQAQEADDMQGETRDQTSNETSNDDEKDDLSNDDDEDSEALKRDAILKQRMKKYKIPKNLSKKDLEGMQGFTKQVYLRGGH